MVDRVIPLSSGDVAVIDECSWAIVRQYHWYMKPCITRHRRLFYVYAAIHGGKKKSVILHRLIMNVPSHLHVDHIDGDGLNNRMSNLRVCTRAQNQANRSNNANSALRLKGVRILSRRYQARLQVEKRSVYLGCYDTPQDAARAYDAAAIQHFGEFARTNAMLGLI